MQTFMPSRHALPCRFLTPLARAVRLTLCSSLIAGVAIPGLAQTPDVAEVSPARAEISLPTVTVKAASTGEATTEGTQSYTTGATSTATGLTLSLRETPQSVTVITRERITDQGLTTITDVVNSATGLSSRQIDSERHGFAARGFDITNLQTDGLPTTWSSGWAAGETLTDTVLYDRVEVVRGATGLVTGAGNPSAAINLVRKRATSKTFTGAAELSLGTRNHRGGTVDLSTPVTEDGRVRARLIGSLRSADSHSRFASNETQVFFGTVEADLTPDTVLRVGASHQTNDPKGSMWGGLPTWFSDGTRTAWDRETNTAARWSSWASKQQTAYAHLEHRLPSGWKLKGAVHRGESEGDLRLLYLSGSPDRTTGLGMGASPAWYLASRVQDDVTLQASGPFSLGGRQHEATVGLQRASQDFRAVGHPASGTATPGNFYIWDGSFLQPTWGSERLNEAFTTEQRAVYGAARLRLSDPLQLVLGARSTRWISSGENSSGLYRFAHDVVTPYAGLLYDINDTYTAYASYTDIFNPQRNRDRFGRYLDPLEGKSLEAGLKAEFLNGRLNAGLAVFRIEQDNLAQVDTGQFVPDTSPPQLAYYAAQGTRSKGYELDLSGEVAPGWNLGLGWSQFSAKDAAGAPVNTHQPRRLLKVFTSYRLPGDWSRLVLGGGVNWESANYTMANNPLGVRERLEQKAYALVSLMARYEVSPRTSLQLNIQNALDETYYSQIGFYNQYAYGAPRSAMLTLKHKF